MMNRLEKALPIILILCALGAFGLMKLPIETVLVIAKSVGWILSAMLVAGLVARGLMKRQP
jgi:hypothetical protein